MSVHRTPQPVESDEPADTDTADEPVGECAIPSLGADQAGIAAPATVSAIDPSRRRLELAARLAGADSAVRPAFGLDRARWR